MIKHNRTSALIFYIICCGPSGATSRFFSRDIFSTIFVSSSRDYILNFWFQSFLQQKRFHHQSWFIIQFIRQFNPKAHLHFVVFDAKLSLLWIKQVIHSKINFCLKRFKFERINTSLKCTKYFKNLQDPNNEQQTEIYLSNVEGFQYKTGRILV